MADIPEGARLEYGTHGPGAGGPGAGGPGAGGPGAGGPGTGGPGTGGPGSGWPVVVVHNVWIFPGVPAIFRRKFDAVREHFRGSPIHARALWSLAGEGEIAGTLDAVVADFPGVDVGSYPHPDAPDHKVKITLDGRDRAAVDAATARLAAALGAAIVRVE